MDQDRLRSHIEELTRVPRPAESAVLEQLRQYVCELVASYGWEIKRHEFSAKTDLEEELQGINLIARYSDAPEGAPRFCVGAHLDSRPDTPGADDNASAVATLLEIARLVPNQWPDNPCVDLELVFFDLEENGMLGGAEHARLCRANEVDLCGMVSLEMLGYCDHSSGSQSLPRALVGLYPDTANFIAVIGNQISTKLIDAFHEGMRQIDELPVETLLVPENGNTLQATRLSDHSPFWDAGYSALMITDTSFMRNPHYHQPTDTLETLDMKFLTRVARGCLNAVQLILSHGLDPKRDDQDKM